MFTSQILVLRSGQTIWVSALQPAGCGRGDGIIPSSVKMSKFQINWFLKIASFSYRDNFFRPNCPLDNRPLRYKAKILRCKCQNRTHVDQIRILKKVKQFQTVLGKFQMYLDSWCLDRFWHKWLNLSRGTTKWTAENEGLTMMGTQIS